MANDVSYINSSKYTYGEFEKKRVEDRNDAILKIGAAGAGITAAHFLLQSQQVQTAASKLFKLDILKDYIQLNQYNWRELPVNPRITLGDLTLGFVKGMEEISPFKVLRTFHASSFLSPAVMAKETKAVTISATQLFLDEEYIRRLVSINSPSVAPDAVNDLFRSGAVYKSGKLYSADQSTEILSHARIVDLAPDIARGSGEKSSPFLNRVYEKFRNVIGVEERSKFFNAAFSDSGGIGIIAGKSNLDITQKWTRAYGRLAVEPGFKIFDKPADFLAELVDKTGLPERYNVFTGLRDKLALNAGTAGDYTKSVPRSFYVSAKNTAKLTAKGTIAYTALDAIVRSIAGEDSPYDKGIAAGLATAYVNARVGVAEKWSDNFQGYKERQEYYAPGSTSLIALSGFPLAGAMLGATVGYSARVKDVAREGFAGSERIFSRESQSGLVNKVLGRTGADAPMMNKTKKFAAIGAIIAAIPALPFLPGAVIGESSERLKAQYSGEEEVAIRSTRFWTSGGTEYGGGKIKYFTRSWYNQLMDNAEDIGRYDNIETKDKLNPYLNPFDYLRNPYQYEELNQDRTPYPVWGMSVSQGGALGKAYELTIGALIKPTIVNDRLDDYVTGGSINSNRGVELKTKVSQKEASLVNDGMMLAPEAAKLNTAEEGASSAYKALTDFAGLKGWAISLLNDATHTGLEDVGKQLAKSGESSNVARELLERNLGGMGPVGESLRRFIPTNAGSVEDNINPLRNLMPEWLPHDPDNYWRDFSIGDPYTSIERGYYRLPGEGYAELFPELKGLDPNDYPDIFKYKILSDVAMGSNEYYAYKDEMDRRDEADVLTDYERKIYDTVKNQELEKSVHKKFAEDLGDKDLNNAGMGNKFMAELWAGATRLAESPTESLTFFRPAAKFLHQRTAVEDYIATQVEGSDIGMWTKPYAHFIKPFANKISPVDIRPQETQEKEAINTYFDKLEYVKNRRLYKEAIKNEDPEAYRYKKNYQTTITGALTTGLDSDMEVTRAYVAMPANERAYFAAFSSETEEKVRKQIVNITSVDIASLYSKIWERRDAMATSSSPEEQEERIRGIAQQEEQEAISDNRGIYDRYQKSGDKSSTFLEYLEDVKAEQYINQATGMPSDDFAGWDPRIDIKDIKLQTLTIGKEDVREFGFWDGDEERLKRLTAVQQEEEVTGQIAAIKDSIKREKSRAAEIKQELYSRGINVSRVSFYTSKTEDLNINIGA